MTESSRRAGQAGAARGGEESLDLGQDWAMEGSATAGGAPARGSTPGGTASGSKSGSPGPVLDPGAPSLSKPWTIVLATYGGDNHEQAAATMLGQLPGVAPALVREARVYPTALGSMVTYGAYTAIDDPRAVDDLKKVKAISRSGRAVFGRALLTRVVDPNTAGGIKPNNLMALRQQYPDVEPLYTLQVAIWGAEDERSEASRQKAQKAAEDYTAQLRAQGYEAYYYHDLDKALSTVTVGAFNASAVDGKSGLYSAEVEALVKKFPAHLVNGQPVEEYTSRVRMKDEDDLKKNPIALQKQLIKTQTPRLVLVPKM